MMCPSSQTTMQRITQLAERPTINTKSSHRPIDRSNSVRLLLYGVPGTWYALFWKKTIKNPSSTIHHILEVLVNTACLGFFFPITLDYNVSCYNPSLWNSTHARFGYKLTFGIRLGFFCIISSSAKGYPCNM